MPLAYATTSSSGDLEFRRVFFLPVGDYRFTAFWAVPGCPDRVWAGGFGQDVSVCSSWSEVVQGVPSSPRALTRSFAPFGNGISAGTSSPDIPRLTDSGRARARVSLPPWFAGRGDEARTCAMLERAFQAAGSRPAGAGPSRDRYLLGAVAACVLVQHVDPTLVHSWSPALIDSLACLLADVVAMHSVSTSAKIVGLATGHGGEKVHDILRGLETLGDVITPNGGAPPRLHFSPAPDARSSDAAMLIFRWAFHSVPRLGDALGASGGAMTHLALDVFDSMVDLHKGHPVVKRLIHSLVWELTVPPTVVRHPSVSLTAVSFAFLVFCSRCACVVTL